MEIQIRDEFIKLGQLLKLAGLADTGVEAKERILAGEIRVNGETELRRGRKCVPGDVIVCGGKSVTVTGK